MGLPSSLKPDLLVLLFCFLNVSTINSTKRLKEEAVHFGGNFPALYVIGDSLVDSGNNNYLPALLKANFTPYGFKFEGGIPTGRFSDGKTIADYIAIYYELPLVPAYMGLSEKQKNNISTGINYASGGCGVFPDTGKQKAGGCLSMGDQVDLFNQTIKKNLKQNFKTQSELNNHLAESLFLIAIGSNDYSFTYDESSTDANSFAEKLLNEYWLQIQRLHKLGARKFFINNIKPVGCYPSRIDKTVPRGSCDEKINRAVTIYNVKLRASLSDMRRHKLSNTFFVYSDYFNFMLGLRGPSSNQFSSKLLNTTSPCCPMVYVQGKFPTCLPRSIPCKLPEMYLFFDPNHPTQMVNFMYAIQCFQERRICHVVRDFPPWKWTRWLELEHRAYVS